LFPFLFFFFIQIVSGFPERAAAVRAKTNNKSLNRLIKVKTVDSISPLSNNGNNLLSAVLAIVLAICK